MNKIFKFFIVLNLLFVFSQDLSFAQNRVKLAQTGFKFLSAPTDARATAMGESYTSISSFSSSLFYNPANLGFMDRTADASFGVNKWIADINYMYASAAYSPADGRYGKIGFTFVSVDYGEFIGTVVDGSVDKGYREWGTYSPKAFSIGIGYANALSDKFSVGGNVKYVRQDLGSAPFNIDDAGAFMYEENKLDAIAFDFGILYYTGFKSLKFGMSVRNFSTELKYKNDGFQLPLTFKLGLSADAMDFFDVDRSVHSLLISVDAAHPRDYPEQIFVGGEYTFYNTLSLRAGYSFPNDERNFSAGVGLKQSLSGVTLGIDYAYTPFGIFSDVHNFSVKFIY